MTWASCMFCLCYPVFNPNSIRDDPNVGKSGYLEPLDPHPRDDAMRLSTSLPWERG